MTIRELHMALAATMLVVGCGGDDRGRGTVDGGPSTMDSGGLPDGGPLRDAPDVPDANLPDTGPPPESMCDDGTDDDGDGDTDCDDSDCAADPACTESCTDGVDDDGDGTVDCEDTDCFGTSECGELEMCTGGTDDDGDGFTDCDDSECACACGGMACPTRTIANRATEDIITNSLCHARTGACSPTLGPDAAYSFTAPATATYGFSGLALRQRAVMYIRDGDCDGPELACEVAFGPGSAVDAVISMTMGQTVIVFVDTPAPGGDVVSLSVSNL